MIDVGDRYEKGNLWFDPLPHFRPAGFGMEKGLDNPAVQPALQLPLARAFLRWSRFPFVQVDRVTAAASGSTTIVTRTPATYGWSAVKLQ